MNRRMSTHAYIKDVTKIYLESNNVFSVSTEKREIFILYKNIESIDLNHEQTILKLILIMKSQHIIYIEYKDDELKIFKKIYSKWEKLQRSHIPETETGAGAVTDPEVD
jgi:hypothetical protein